MCVDRALAFSILRKREGKRVVNFQLRRKNENEKTSFSEKKKITPPFPLRSSPISLRFPTDETMRRPSVLLATLAVLLALCSPGVSAVAVTNAPSAITVQARGCSAVELTGLNSKFSYEAALLGVESSPFCSKSMVK